jgi:hypothetical protein
MGIPFETSIRRDSIGEKRIDEPDDSPAVVLDRSPRCRGQAIGHEVKAIAAAGIDAVIPHGFEAGGHRGVFVPDRGDDRLKTVALTRCWCESSTSR